MNNLVWPVAKSIIGDVPADLLHRLTSYVMHSLDIDLSTPASLIIATNTVESDTNPPTSPIIKLET